MKNENRNPHRILLVEDEESLAVGLEFNLSGEGYTVTLARDGRQALVQVRNHTFDLIILDIMLPYVDGFEVARQIREKDIRLPILMLTAKTGAQDRVRGLELGADDYLTKPFHLEELLLRVKGMLRRKEWYRESLGEQPLFRFGENEVNFETLTARTGEKTIRLTPHEAYLLKYLVENRGKVLSRGELLEKVWQTSADLETRTVDNFIVRLRRYFEPDPDNPVYFRSVRGVGYVFGQDIL